MIKAANDEIQFRIELFLALIITGLACCAGFSNLLFAPNELYPAATDYMGHMAKVQYIVQCMKEGILPSWYPYWYNGSTVNQYYPPLSYYLMAPIYALTDNIMLTFKINCFTMMLTGGMGVWYFCRMVIGKWCGLLASVFYCLQPFLLTSLFMAGVLAQGPIYAITPWLLFLVLSCAKMPTRWNLFLCALLTALLILSHAMHAFMIILSIMVVLFFFAVFKRIRMTNYMILIILFIFSALMTAFWSVVGVTKLENPTIPYLLPGAAANVTAAINWFNPKNMGSILFYFGFPVLIFTVLATLTFVFRASKRKLYDAEKLEIPFCVCLTFFTLIFSFGKQTPGFQLFPISDSLVPGRILTLTAVTGAFAGAYLFYLLLRVIPTLKVFFRIVLAILTIAAIAVSLYAINPYQYTYSLDSYDRYKERFETIDIPETSFDVGRYYSYGGSSSNEISVPVLYGFNNAEGWNIEGSPHNRFLWNQASCVQTKTYDYFAKNLAFWNVRYLSLPAKDKNMIAPLQGSLDFQQVKETDFYTSDVPSSYFLLDHRNGLIFGAGAPAVAMEFPYLVYEQRDDISDYTMKELEKYKMIYLCEPAVDTIREKRNIEDMVNKLVKKGITVIIEPTSANKYKLFDVTVSDVNLEESPVLQKQSGTPIKNAAETINVDEDIAFARVLFGLDKVYYKLVQNNSRLKNDVIGTKKVGDGEVVFIGMHLSQYLKAVYTRNWGVPENQQYPECSDEVKNLFEVLFEVHDVNTDFWPQTFLVQNANWNYKGVTFNYSNREAREVTVSVTYTPRWKATIDGKPIAVGQKENLITIDLPAGEHRVKLSYGITKYGIAGYTISLVGLFILLLFLRFYDIILYKFKQICICFSKFLQLNNNN